MKLPINEYGLAAAVIIVTWRAIRFYVNRKDRLAREKRERMELHAERLRSRHYSYEQRRKERGDK